MQKPKRTKTFRIWNDLYKFYLELYQSDGFDAKFFKKQGIEYEDSEVERIGALTAEKFDGGVLHTAIFFRYPAEPHTVAHEAVHVVNSVFQNTGVNTSYDDDEHYAYLLGWVVKMCHERLEVRNPKEENERSKKRSKKVQQRKT